MAALELRAGRAAPAARVASREAPMECPGLSGLWRECPPVAPDQSIDLTFLGTTGGVVFAVVLLLVVLFVAWYLANMAD
jgi:hypothetical protein